MWVVSRRYLSLRAHTRAVTERIIATRRRRVSIDEGQGGGDGDGDGGEDGDGGAAAAAPGKEEEEYWFWSWLGLSDDAAAAAAPSPTAAGPGKDGAGAAFEDPALVRKALSELGAGGKAVAYFGDGKEDKGARSAKQADVGIVGSWDDDDFPETHVHEVLLLPISFGHRSLHLCGQGADVQAHPSLFVGLNMGGLPNVVSPGTSSGASTCT